MSVKLEIKGNFLYITDTSENEVNRFIKSFTTFDYTMSGKYLSIKL